MLNEILWLNSHIHIDKKPYINVKWIKAGVLYIEHLYDHNMKLKTWEKIKEEFLLTDCEWLEYIKICKAIPQAWKDLIDRNVVIDKDKKKWYDVCLYSKKISSVVYNKLIDDSELTVLKKYARRWEIPIQVEELQKAFSYLYCYTSNTKLRGFQYRLLLHKIPLNDELYRWGKVDTPKCDFCKIANDDYVHRFIQCNKIKPIIENN